MFQLHRSGRDAAADVHDPTGDDPAIHDHRLGAQPLLHAASISGRDLASSAREPRCFTSDHRRTLQHAATLQDSVCDVLMPDRAAAASRATQRLLERDSMSFLGDLLDIHWPSRSPQDLMAAQRLREECRRTVGDVLDAMAVQLRRGQIKPQAVVNGLTVSGMEDRPPFLLALATAAIHDRELADAMCGLLTALSGKLDKPAVSGMLLTTDSALGCRPQEQLPEELSEKYTDFLGRLIGDGLGEWGNDGAVHAIKRLNDAGLLPDKEAVRRRHSTPRWRKQAKFVRICEDLALRPPWDSVAPPRCPQARRATMTHVLSAADEVSARAAERAREHGTEAYAGAAAAWRSRIRRALDDSWLTACHRYRSILLHAVHLPSAGLPGGCGGSGVRTEARERCLPGVLRLGGVPSSQALDAVMREVFEDPEVRLGLAQGADLDDPRLSAAVDAAARDAASRLLDPAERLDSFLTVEELADCDRRHAPLARR